MTDTLRELLGPGGALSRALPIYEPRPPQLEMALRVEDALAHGRALVVEAGTGTGKTLAYLPPAAGRRASCPCRCPPRPPARGRAPGHPRPAAPSPAAEDAARKSAARARAPRRGRAARAGCPSWFAAIIRAKAFGFWFSFSFLIWIARRPAGPAV